MMVPVGRLVVLRVTAKQDLITAIAYLTWPALMAPVIGPPLGGLITEHASWRSIFFLNVPLGLIGALAALRLIPNDRPAGRPPLDVAGFLLSGFACAGFMYALDLMGQPDATWTQAGLIVLSSLLVGVVAVRHFQRTAHPLIDLQALAIPTFAVTIWGGSLFRMAINAAPFLLPLMFQLAFGMDAFSAGLLVLAVFAGNLLMKFVTTPILRRFGFKRVLVVNGVLTALSLAACALLTPGTPGLVILAVLF
jgi:MFS family permease